MPRPVDPKARRRHRLFYLGMAVFIAGGIIVMLASQTAQLGGTISVEELSKNVGRDPYHHVVIDLRTPGEYRAGHIPFSVNFPSDQIGRRLGELEDAKGRQVVVVGPKSAEAMTYLRQAGFQSVLDLPEGIEGWQASGRELSVDDDSPFHKMLE